MYNARTFSNDTKSEAPAVGGKHGKGVDGLFENVSYLAPPQSLLLDGSGQVRLQSACKTR